MCKLLQSNGQVFIFIIVNHCDVSVGVVVDFNLHCTRIHVDRCVLRNIMLTIIDSCVIVAVARQTIAVRLLQWTILGTCMAMVQEQPILRCLAALPWGSIHTAALATLASS